MNQHQRDDEPGGSLSRLSLIAQHSLVTHPLSVLILISMVAVTIYSNTFFSSFHFDDSHAIVNNFDLRDLGNFLEFSGSRFIGYLSFALNYHFGKLNVFGYHLINLIIHILNGLLVYWLVLLLLKISLKSSGLDDSSPGTQHLFPWVALTTSLLFVVHPIQTQAVTYIVQRFASLATLFYLLSVVTYLEFRVHPPTNKKRFLWYLLALLSTVIAMKTKEISFTLPLILILTDVAFPRPGNHFRWIALIPFLLTLPIIPLSHPEVLEPSDGEFVSITDNINRWDYLLTQFRVIMTYLRLVFVPVHQNIDYDFPLYHSLLDIPILLSFVFLFALFCLSIFLIKKTPLSLHNSSFPAHYLRLIGFGILWFFITISVESSIIPIADVIFEHRMYLPSVGLFMALVLMVYPLLTRPPLRHAGDKSTSAFFRSAPKPVLFISPILILLSLLTYQRNNIWIDGISLWKDAVAKAPGNARAHVSLGHAYKKAGKIDHAITENWIAIDLKPNYAKAYNNLGVAYKDLGQHERAIETLQKALEIDSHYSQAYNSLGSIYNDLGQYDEAVIHYQKAIQIHPGFVRAHYNLGNALRELGQWDKAIKAYQIAILKRPDFAMANNNLANIFAAQGRTEEAIEAYQSALRYQPEHIKARNNLATVYKDLGRYGEAIREWKAVLKDSPNYQPAHYNLALAFQDLGNISGAIDQYLTAIRLKPSDVAAHNNLADLYIQQEKFQEAIEEYQWALDIDPRQIQTHYNFGILLTRLGNIEEAREQYEQVLRLDPKNELAHQALKSLNP